MNRQFRYHPDPVATGSAEPTDQPCALCGMVTGWTYGGPVFAVRDWVGSSCLECIADGTAANRLGEPDEPAEFTDIARDVRVSNEIREEILHRTPGFDAWQQPEWQFHCGDGAAYLGRIGWEQVRGNPALTAALHDAPLTHLEADGEATAYWFRCLHCGLDLATWDAA